MASRRRSLVSYLCLSLILLTTVSNAHPNGRMHATRRSLDTLVQQLAANTSVLDPALGDNVANDAQSLPTSLKNFLSLVSLGLKLFGDALSNLLAERIGPGSTSTSALLTDVPNLAPLLATTSWANFSRSTASTSIEANITSHITVTRTSTRTLTASISRIPLGTGAIASVSTIPLIKQNTIPFEQKTVVQVYAGREPGITKTLEDLQTLCTSPDIDIITLAGITNFFSDQTPRPIPVADFDTLCNATTIPTPTGDENCSKLSELLRSCQTTNKKKLFLAIETGTDTTTLYNPREARTLARLLWDIYGAGKTTVNGARKYLGPPINSLGVVFDGFEFLVNTTTIDEAYFAAFQHSKRQNPQVFTPPTLPFFDVLFDSLRTLFTTEGDPTALYYLSVSLPCTRPSILPKQALHLTDFVSVRFMDDIACDINGLAFTNFLATWGQDIESLGPSSKVDIPALPATTESLSVLPASTTTMETTVVHTTTVHTANTTASGIAATEVTQAFRRYPQPAPPLPPSFTITVYPTSPLSETMLLSPWPATSPSKKPKPKRHNHIPFFLLGIPVPSQEVQNATSLTGSGSADPATIGAILDLARSVIPEFAGVLLWGGVEEMEVLRPDGYLYFIEELLGRGAAAGMGIGNGNGNGNGSAPYSVVQGTTSMGSVTAAWSSQLASATGAAVASTGDGGMGDYYTTTVYYSGSAMGIQAIQSWVDGLGGSLIAVATLNQPSDSSVAVASEVPPASAVSPASAIPPSAASNTMLVTSIAMSTSTSASLATPSSPAPIASSTVSAKANAASVPASSAPDIAPSSSAKTASPALSAESEPSVVVVRSTRVLTAMITLSASGVDLSTMNASATASSV